MIEKRQVCLATLASGATLLAAGGLGGCVERKLVIGSSPEGALVQVNDIEVGRTPVRVPFKWYGDYDLRFRKEQQTVTEEGTHVKRWYLHTHKKANAPWFEFLGMDLVAELLPIPFVDEQVWAFEVPEVQSATDAELIQRAQQLKGDLDKEQSRQK